jgi:hypothetical protein
LGGQNPLHLVGGNSKRHLYDKILHEVSQDARCVLARSQRNATKVIENVNPTTIIIEPAIVDNISRAPAAASPNRRGHQSIQDLLPVASASIKAIASAMLPATIRDGKNQ